MLRNSRFNPTVGILDFWNEFKRPNPYRWPILGVSVIPFALILAWAGSEAVYIPPERPNITYISTYAPDRSDEEIAASNEANQRLKDERAEQEAELAERKRDLYKALGAASGFDVEAMEEQAEAERSAAEAEAAARRAEMFPDRDNSAAEEGGAP